jgi:peptide chain release factor 1
VAVLRLDSAVEELDLKDVAFAYARGSGPGGQHRNKTESCVIAVHVPTGARVRIDLRSQHQSKAMALRVLSARIADEAVDSARRRTNKTRQAQIGSGMRGDKIRTSRSQDNQVTDHRTGQKWSLDRWLKGDW